MKNAAVGAALGAAVGVLVMSLMIRKLSASASSGGVFGSSSSGTIWM
ncbi:hypothetical protein [Oceanospirillum maris]|nr:hypothetical protein [Oceanospirillum maris]